MESHSQQVVNDVIGHHINKMGVSSAQNHEKEDENETTS